MSYVEPRSYAVANTTDQPIGAKVMCTCWRYGLRWACMIDPNTTTACSRRFDN